MSSSNFKLLHPKKEDLILLKSPLVWAWGNQLLFLFLPPHPVSKSWKVTKANNANHAEKESKTEIVFLYLVNGKLALISFLVYPGLIKAQPIDNSFFSASKNLGNVGPKRRYVHRSYVSQECFWLLETLPIGHLLLLSRKFQSSGPRVSPKIFPKSSVWQQCLLIATRWLLQLPALYPHNTESLGERREERAKTVLLCLSPSVQHPLVLSFNTLTSYWPSLSQSL